MTSARIRQRAGLALALSGMALAVTAFVAGATPSHANVRANGAPHDAVSATAAITRSALGLTRDLTAMQAAHGLRYQCMQDFRRCTRGIAVSSSWTSKLAQEVFDAEYSSCCYEAGLCGDFLATVGDRTLVADYRSDIDSACAAVSSADALPALHGLLQQVALDQ